MYKRRDYHLLHANNQKDASDSSSSSGSDADARADRQSALSDSEDEGSSLRSSGIEGESDADQDRQGAVRIVASCDRETDNDREPSSDEETGLFERRQQSQGAEPSNPWAEAVEDTERGRNELDDEELVVQVGKVFKCRLCPNVLCLNEGTMLAHLKSKKHARYLQQLAAGRGRLLIDSDGEDLAEEAETHAERHARMLHLAAAEGAASEAAEKESPLKKKRRKESGRQRQRKRLKMKEQVEHANGHDEKKDGAESSKRPEEVDRMKSNSKSANRKERRKSLPRSGPTAAASGPLD
ncbi:hypothetical protein KFL_002220070 [Klebsormidium nitens]|uniref:C2H2-type domain-containing protein n=1 Tax=Klebsormidium nitens TaxID=105231 RepID=A0A1Y1I3V6_KLENI|nr:hypothetical protein KFL_002220070 [Klebsormidium nitens]|eukprot:GAQ85163.1 hypothetical protein KFL_002220070 [Klebsormidium nitens]